MGNWLSDGGFLVLLFLLIIISLVLLCSTLLLFYRKQKRDQELHYIYQKLNKIWTDKTQENVQLFTDDKKIIALLIEINRLLEQKNKTELSYKQMEKSIRRMYTNMSHDLKTPLTVILGHIEMLSIESDLSWDEQQKRLLKIQDKAKKMHFLMDQFFDLAKMESNDLSFPLTEVNINEVCKNNMLFFYEQIVSKGLEVKIDIPESPIFVESNVDALDRILKNLLSNAIRYGSDGQIIGLKLRKDDQYVWIDVWDRGKGISEKEQKLVFERLYTLDDARNESNQGSGLGLTITKRLTEKINGSIQLRSKPYDKTIFTIRFERQMNS
jgi:signal transduction histidine kinase